jgi:hypothetical protein
MTILLAGFLLVVGVGLLPIGPPLVAGMLAGPVHADRVVAVPLAPDAPAVAECDCGVPSSPRGPR